MQYKYSLKLGNILLFTIIFLVLSFNFLNINIIKAEQIEIRITDIEGYPIDEIIEGNDFKISIYDADLTENIFLVDFTIEMDNKKYYISDETDNSELLLSAPMVDYDKQCEILAYNDTKTLSKTIKIKNVELHVKSLSGPIIEEGRLFSIRVTDGDNPISGVRVYIQNVQNYDKSDGITDENGEVVLKAPTKRDEITVLADYNSQKKSISLTLQIEPTFFDEILQNTFTPIIFALIILIIVIIFVSIRQRKSIYSRSKEITKEKKLEKLSKNKEYGDKSDKKFDFNKKASTLDDNKVRTSPKNDSKVEEIRISRTKKEKEIFPIKPEEEPTKKVILEKKNQINKNNQDWFHGKDDIRYEIDKLTGEVDEEGLDKWFEGVDKLKEKIDEKVKKDKKKDKEDN